MTTASGTGAGAAPLALMPGGRVRGRHDMAAPGAQHVPADDGRQLDRPDEPGRQPRAGRLVEGGAEQVRSRAGTGRRWR